MKQAKLSKMQDIALAPAGIGKAGEAALSVEGPLPAI
jgi:hypothetical protein